MSENGFGLHLSVQAPERAVALLDDFIVRLSACTEVQVVSRTANALEAEATVRIPWAYKEQARIAWNIYTAGLEERYGAIANSLRLELESVIL